MPLRLSVCFSVIFPLTEICGKPENMLITETVCVSPVLSVHSVAAEELFLPSSSLVPVLLGSKQMTSCMDDLTSCCVETDADDGATCCATSAKRSKRKL